LCQARPTCSQHVKCLTGSEQTIQRMADNIDLEGRPRMLEILHVDDEPDIREVAALSLAIDPKIIVRSAKSGLEALEQLDSGWKPDVVLLDVMMPDLDGPGTLERIRQRPAHVDTPVIFMTARAQPSEQARFIAMGAIAVITKPFDPVTLAAQIREHFAAHR